MSQQHCHCCWYLCCDCCSCCHWPCFCHCYCYCHRQVSNRSTKQQSTTAATQATIQRQAGNTQTVEPSMPKVTSNKLNNNHVRIKTHKVQAANFRDWLAACGCVAIVINSLSTSSSLFVQRYKNSSKQKQTNKQTKTTNKQTDKQANKIK